MDYTTVYEITNEMIDLELAVPLILVIGGFWAFYKTIHKNRLIQQKSKNYFTLFLGLGFGSIFSVDSAIGIPKSLKKLSEHTQIFL